MRRSAVAPLALLLPLAACGAMPADRDPDEELDPGPPIVPCGAPLQFSLPGLAGVGSDSGTTATLSALAATATHTDYVMLVVDSAGDVHGFSYALDGSQLVSHAVNAPVWSGATGPVAAVDTGGKIGSLLRGSSSTAASSRSWCPATAARCSAGTSRRRMVTER
jgi:hypothetical protein